MNRSFRKRTARGALAILLPIILCLAAQSPATAAVYNNYKNYVSQRCIGISRTVAGIWDCTSNADQEWKIVYQSDGIWFLIENEYSLCLTAGYTPVSNDTVEAATCDPQLGGWLWRIGDTINLAGHPYTHLINKASGLVLGTDTGSSVNGTHLVVYASRNHTDQYWWFEGE